MGPTKDTPNRPKTNNRLWKTFAKNFSEACGLRYGLEKTLCSIAMDESKWDQLFSTNTKSVYWTTRAVWPTMEKQRSGVIVNTASVIAFKGVSGMAAYCASKAAVVMLTKVLAIEGAPIGLRVNCVCPGFIDTPMTDWVGSQQPDSEAWLIDMHENIPLNRSGRPEEVARASLFLSSDESSYVTGETIMVDGGVTTGFDVDFTG